jgi:hypothetical protein
MTELLRLYAIPGRQDAGWLYRLVSGMAHGRPWALGLGAMEPIHAPVPPGGAVLSATADREGVELLARV